MTVEILITTPAFDAGREAARRDLARDPDSKPLPELLSRVGAEFKAGYLFEHREQQ